VIRNFQQFPRTYTSTWAPQCRDHRRRNPGGGRRVRLRHLYEERNLRLLTAVQDALHAHACCAADVDYVVKNGAIELVDEFKGRIAQNHRWPPDSHRHRSQRRSGGEAPGMILGSDHAAALIALYRGVWHDGTASTQALELQKLYGLLVEAIPTHRPVIRVDHPDASVHGESGEESSGSGGNPPAAHAIGAARCWWGPPASRNRKR